MNLLLRRAWTILLVLCVSLVSAAAGKGAVRPWSVVVAGTPGAYELLVGGRPFYVRGVSLSLNEDPDDPRESLTHARLRFHLKRVRQMGANTIRRYGHTDDTGAILQAAWELGLMVMMGYWLEHDVDYLTDRHRLEILRQRIREWVLRFKDHPAVLAWVLGNETWGLLKKEFPVPENLTPRRAAFYRFVEETAQMIQSLDPHHPVIVVDEHVPGALSAHQGLEESLAMFRQHVRSVDIFGVNSYFPQDIGVLHTVIRNSGLRRPYMVTEFGPPGYWLPNLVADDLGEPVEPTDFEKAAAYPANWRNHIEAHRGWNLGGNAFAWKDKHEGSFTWFGLTDNRDRLKPAYWALREAWTGQRPPPGRPMVVEFSINKRSIRPDESFVVRTRLLPSLNPGDFTYTYMIAPTSMAYVYTQVTTDLPYVSLHAPGVPGVYRAYVYVTDRRDAMVSTGSATFAVYTKKRGGQ